MRILVVGAGSTGGYFGGRLAAAGRDVTFLVRPGRAAALARDGLQIISPHGNLTFAPQTITADAITGPYDVVLLTVKAFSLEAALADVAPAIGPDTMILPVLNGMRHMDTLAERFGAEALIGCLCKIVGTLDAEGRIVQLTPMHELTYGELNGQPSERMVALDTVMQDAGFDARLSADIEREMWEKWILLATLGGVTCLMRGTIGEIVATPGGTALILRFLNEVMAVSSTVGRVPSDGFVAFATGLLTEAGSPMTSSMYRDLVQNASIEADQILGDLLARGQRAGVDTPLLIAAYAQLAVYQNRRMTG